MINEKNNISQNNKNKQLQIIIEYLPLIIFFISYKINNSLIFASLTLLITTIILTIIAIIKKQKIPNITIISTAFIIFFASLTIIFNNEIFIKIKPTIINFSFFLVLLIASIRKKPILHKILHQQLPMLDSAYITLGYRFAFFFLFLAIGNEIIWRNFSTDLWIKFKIFGTILLITIFTALQSCFINKENQKFQQQQES
jgi:intracellular septation protein